MIIPLKDIFNNINYKPKKVIHIGGHFGEEADFYKEIGVEHALFFEPMSESYAKCKEKVERFGYSCSNLALGSDFGEADMYTETVNGGQSSSLLKPKVHTEKYPSILFDGRERVIISTLDKEMSKYEGLYDMINIDVQGYELEVLKGGVETLKGVSAVYSEINFEEMYEGCVLSDELDSFMEDHNFRRVVTADTKLGWGDALYLKVKA